MISRLDMHMVGVHLAPRLQSSGAEVVMLEGAHITWMARAGAWPRRVCIAAIAQVKTRYGQLKKRYGPRYTSAMVGTACFTLFLPIPAISLLTVASIVLTAEIHRAVSKRRCT